VRAVRLRIRVGAAASSACLVALSLGVLAGPAVAERPDRSEPAGKAAAATPASSGQGGQSGQSGKGKKSTGTAQPLATLLSPLNEPLPGQSGASGSGVVKSAPTRIKKKSEPVLVAVRPVTQVEAVNATFGSASVVTSPLLSQPVVAAQTVTARVVSLLELSGTPSTARLVAPRAQAAASPSLSAASTARAKLPVELPGFGGRFVPRAADLPMAVTLGGLILALLAMRAISRARSAGNNDPDLVWPTA